MKCDFEKKMALLNDAEKLLASCSIHGRVTDHQTHMQLNRMIMDEARSQLAEVSKGAGKQSAR